jgi:hypothetical protein
LRDHIWAAIEEKLPGAMEGYVERGFSHTESQTARFAALLGREPGSTAATQKN